MATSTIPVSNVAGNNQTSPGSGLQTPMPIVSKATPGVGSQVLSTPMAVAQSNPLIPSTATSTVPTTAPSATSLTTQQQNNLGTQETDIYGQGIGGALSSLLEGIGGTSSASLQDYITSLAPQEATAQAGLDASLGASGVNPNSSVAAIGNANLQAQETGAIAGEEANLTQSNQSLSASILTGQEQAAEQEVASSGWDVFGQVLGGLGNLAGDVVGAAGKAGGFSDLFS